MPEVSPDFPREWADVPDQDGGRRIYRYDLTWLTSHWGCIFGRGCPGTRHENQGCCTVGAHWSGTDDRDRVEKHAQNLTPDIWQFYDEGHAGGVTVHKDSGPGQTRIVDGACIFLNRPGFPTGPGCALHVLAERAGVPALTTKPDVCWQIPIQIKYSWSEDRTGEQVLVVTVTEYDRTGWGPGGQFMNWWCSGNTEAHTEGPALYESYAGELRQLIGPANYDVLKGICDERMRDPQPPHPHPADPGQSPRGWRTGPVDLPDPVVGPPGPDA
ncbi:hypothetical protein [Streptomyces sp. NPDC048419]|uniref:hypothetical protein n=1 Tax=Streptomyces sp. NPDC048419 TaxID=3365547 RepID=UPI00371BD4A0